MIYSNSKSFVAHLNFLSRENFNKWQFKMKKFCKSLPCDRSNMENVVTLKVKLKMNIEFLKLYR